jgi:hypothetical protein
MDQGSVTNHTSDMDRLSPRYHGIPIAAFADG